MPTTPTPSGTYDHPRRFGVTVDEMSEDSFPASDPPAVWTWDVESAREDPRGAA